MGKERKNTLLLGKNVFYSTNGSPLNEVSTLTYFVFHFSVRAFERNGKEPKCEQKPGAETGWLLSFVLKVFT
jgi:hypothetical protein